jgi:uncharacterized protein YifE (UPF0438 family)
MESKKQMKSKHRNQSNTIRTITLPQPSTPSTSDQKRYVSLIHKDERTDEEREELKRLYEKYTNREPKNQHTVKCGKK